MMSHQQKLFPQSYQQEQEQERERDHEMCTNLKRPPPYGRGLMNRLAVSRSARAQHGDTRLIKIGPVDPEFYSGQDTHTTHRHRRSVILGRPRAGCGRQ